MPCLTREATEVFLRKAVKESRPNVVFKTGTVSGVLSQEKGLTGVTVRENGVEKQEQADFVIGKLLKALKIRKHISLLRINTLDATGPSQVSYSKWLRSAGFSLPSDLRLEYDPILRYAASVWTIPEHLHSKWPVPWGFKCGYTYTLSPDAALGDPKTLGFAMAENNQSTSDSSIHVRCVLRLTWNSLRQWSSRSEALRSLTSPTLYPNFELTQMAYTQLIPYPNVFGSCLTLWRNMKKSVNHFGRTIGSHP